MTTAQPLTFETPDRGEEAARADLYGLLATLFYAPPSQALLDTIAAEQTEGSGVLECAWTDLAAACRSAEAESARDEYETLFIGVGKPQILLYGSYYLSGFLMEKPLAALRSDLASLGLQRDEKVAETEDHIAALCEVMRYLITSDNPEHASMARQKQFFATHMQPWINTMCDVIASHPEARLYTAVAHFGKSFFDVEMQAFDMI